MREWSSVLLLSLGEGHVCLPRNACRRGITGTPPSEATFRRGGDCTRGCVAGRKWRAEEARVSVVTCQLKGNLAVAAMVASPCLHGHYCKIPLQLRHVTTLTLASSGRHFLPATHPLVQSASRRYVASEGVPLLRPLLPALRCGQNPSSPRERGVTPRPPLDIL